MSMLYQALVDKRLDGCRISLWHIVPLQRLPRVFLDGKLLSATKLGHASQPLSPRQSSMDCDNQMGLSDYVHLYMYRKSEMIKDKFRRGYPHCILRFPIPVVDEVDRVGLLPGNPRGRSWPTNIPKEAIWDLDIAADVARHRDLKNGSILIPQSLDLKYLDGIWCFSQEERSLVAELADELGFKLPVVETVFSTTEYEAKHIQVIREYFSDCRKGERNWRNPPPEQEIPFD